MNKSFSALEEIQATFEPAETAVQNVLASRYPDFSLFEHDPDWRKAEILMLLLEDISILLKNNANQIIGVQQRKLISTAFDFTIGYGLRPYLMPGISRSRKNVATKDPKEALLEHRRLVCVVRVFLHFCSHKHLKDALLGDHLSDLMLGLLQLTQAPILKGSDTESSSDMETAKDDLEITSLASILNTSRDMPTEDIAVKMVIGEQLVNKARLQPHYELLVKNVYQPLLFYSCLSLQSSKNPSWLKKSLAISLSKALTKENGLCNFLLTIDSKFSLQWKSLEDISNLVVNTPSFTNPKNHTENIGRQIVPLLFSCKNDMHFQILLKIVETLLDRDRNLGVEFLFKPLFHPIIELLSSSNSEEDDSRKIEAEYLENHLEFVLRALPLLRQNASLCQGLSVFLSMYLRLALFTSKSASSTKSLSRQVLLKLCEGTDEPGNLLVDSMDPENTRFYFKEFLCFEFSENGGVEISTKGTAYVPQMDSFIELFHEMWKDNPKLICRVYCVLLRRFDSLKRRPHRTSTNFKIVVSALLDSLSELVQTTIMDDIELMTEFGSVQLDRYFEDEDDENMEFTLGLMETLVSNADRLTLESKSILLKSVLSLKAVQTSQFEGRCRNLIQDAKIQLQDVPASEKNPFTGWNFAACALKQLFGREWVLDSIRIERDEEQPSSLEELVLKDIKRNKASRSVHGSMGTYKTVKSHLCNPDTAFRGHGFIQLRKLLSSRDPEAMEDLDHIDEICKSSMEDADSYIYLGAVQCYAIMVDLETEKRLPELLELLKKAEDERMKVILAETLSRCIPHFGDMLPVYSKLLMETFIEYCNDENHLMRVFGCSQLGRVVGQLKDTSRYFRQILNLLAKVMITDSDEMARWAAAEGLSNILKLQDKVSLVNDYPEEIRDLHRVSKRIFSNTDDVRLKAHLQEILLTLGEIAKMLLNAPQSAAGQPASVI